MSVQLSPQPQASGTAASRASSGTTTKALTSSCSPAVRCPSSSGRAPGPSMADEAGLGAVDVMESLPRLRGSNRAIRRGPGHKAEPTGSGVHDRTAPTPQQRVNCPDQPPVASSTTHADHRACPARAAVELGEEADHVRRRGMRVVAPPDEPDRHRRCVAEAAEDDAVAPVLAEGALGGHADAASGGDDGQPVVDVVDLLDPGAAVGWPEVGGGRAGARIDGHDPVREVGQAQLLPAPGERVGRGQRAVPRLQPDDGAVDPTVEPGRCRVRARTTATSHAPSASPPVGVLVRTTAGRRRGGARPSGAGTPRCAPPSPPRRGRCAAGCARPGPPVHEVVDLGEHPAGVRQHPLPRRGEHDLPAGPAQETHAERVLERGERARHRRLRDAELGGGSGEARQARRSRRGTQVPDLDVHAYSV